MKQLRKFIAETKKMRGGTGDTHYGVTSAFYPVEEKKRRVKK